CLFCSVLAGRPPGPTLFPYTTLFRSVDREEAGVRFHALHDQVAPLRDLGVLGAAQHHLDRLAAAADQAAAHARLRLDATERAERSEEHTSELQSRENLVCRLLLEKKK